MISYAAYHSCKTRYDTTFSVYGTKAVMFAFTFTVLHQQAVREAATIRPCKLTFDLLTLKVVSEHIR